MFEQAIKAVIPVIGVHTDDPVNRVRIVQLIAGIKTEQYKATALKGLPPSIFWTADSSDVTTTVYEKLRKEEKTLVVFNPEGDNPLILDCGDLPTPPEFLRSVVEDYVDALSLSDVCQVLKGLSLKRAEEILKLARALNDGKPPKVPEVRRMRSQMGEQVQGLIPVDTAYEFYDFPEKLKLWLELNRAYFVSPKTPRKLIPRGVLLDGPPGVGKSMGAKAVARTLGVPLYRLDIASTLNRYIGESESRVNRALALLEREGPCVLLLDEVEKVFIAGSDDLVISRIMSQLLWWLAEHQGRIITVMTTNNKEAIPSELYRKGRVDLVLRIPRLGRTDAGIFANTVFKSVMGKNPTLSQSKHIVDALKASGTEDHSHAEVDDLIYTLIKSHNWYKLD